MTDLRCPWPTKPLDIEYHDTEWGVPVHDDRVRFEFLTLEGAQAGLSWSTVLARRTQYARAFANWDIAAIAQFAPSDIERLVTDAGLIRHRGKIESTVTNAQAFRRVQAEFGTFDTYVWRFVDGTPRVNRWRAMRDVPTKTAESDALSKDLIKRGFKFVGSTICYAYMQATGMVNDHLVSCPRHAELTEPHHR
ncbi:MAG: DNA-3-methyladenine glycosylase I [Gemmatimonadaceae bacterium]|nr:DNA-3-methyladenine glycosylase I [Gemmatimonadaceae bacterium]